jgi:nucleoside 2-deoxyribosyltransferase
MMKIYLICPVRNTTFDSTSIVENLETSGHIVHFPPRDVDQLDPIGTAIVSAHLEAMRKADAVYVVWDVNSKGSHFDLGMAVALNKPLVLISTLQDDAEGKSYLKVIKALSAKEQRLL